MAGVSTLGSDENLAHRSEWRMPVPASWLLPRDRWVLNRRRDRIHLWPRPRSHSVLLRRDFTANLKYARPLEDHLGIALQDLCLVSRRFHGHSVPCYLLPKRLDAHRNRLSELLHRRCAGTSSRPASSLLRLDLVPKANELYGDGKAV